MRKCVSEMNINNDIFFVLVEEQLAAGQQVKIALKGTSMLPTLCEEDNIVLEPLIGEPAIGDVLLFRVNGGHIVHRFIRRENDRYILQGDNNYTTEEVGRDGLLARLVAVERPNGNVIETTSPEWQRISLHALHRKKIKNMVFRWFGRTGRRQLRPWYFAFLAILMWAPLNGIGVPLDNYLLGLRLDHLLHASVFIPCTLFLVDFFGVHRWKWPVWATAVGVGILTESVQWILPYRGFDINDLVANFLGVTLGWVIILSLREVHRRHQCPARVRRGGCK